MTLSILASIDFIYEEKFKNNANIDKKHKNIHIYNCIRVYKPPKSFIKVFTNEFVLCMDVMSQFNGDWGQIKTSTSMLCRGGGLSSRQSLYQRFAA